MDNRELKGLQIAAVSKVVKSGDIWLVPSQTGDGTQYKVNPEAQWCSCPDHDTRQVKCKHIYAVEFTIKREISPNGKVTETKTVKVTYAQTWPVYNKAQVEEKDRFIVLLADLCKGVPQPEQHGAGRPLLPLRDMAFAAAYKVYTMFSVRRFSSDLREAADTGAIAKAPHYNSVCKYLGSPALTPILKNLIETSAIPLKAVETDFAIDSSGFGTSRFVRWFNKKYGREIDNREWVKAHLTCGVKTHIVTAVEISGWAANDTTYFQPLLETTAKNFQIAQVSADKAYSSHKNLALVSQAGGVPFIPFKSNTVAPTDDSVWAKMYHFYMFNRERFLEHYHKRSNVETVFSMIKGKFGDAVRSKTDTAQVNEVLAKVLCHNICVLIQSMCEFGVEPTFLNATIKAEAVPIAAG